MKNGKLRTILDCHLIIAIIWFYFVQKGGNLRKIMGGTSVKEPFLTVYVSKRCYHGMGLISVAISCMRFRFRVGIYLLEVHTETMITSNHNMSKLFVKLTLGGILRCWVSIAMRFLSRFDDYTIVSWGILIAITSIVVVIWRRGSEICIDYIVFYWILNIQVLFIG